MPSPVTFKVVVRDDGDIELKVPQGTQQQRNAGLLSKFTEKLAGLLGRIKERHVGKPVDNHHHIHADGTIHENH